MHGRTLTATNTYFPGSSEEIITTSEERNSSSESDLFRVLLPRFDLNTIEQAIRWLEVSVCLGKTRWGLGGPWVYVLTEKAIRVADEGKFSSEDKVLLYQDDPYGVFIAQQFNSDDHKLVTYLKQDVLGKAGFTCYEGKSEGLEPFRTAILSKIQKARFFVCLLTKRAAVKSGGHISSVWLYQETGAAVAYGKAPLLLVEDGMDPQYIGELQKVYEYEVFTRSNHPRVFQTILPRLHADLDAHGIVRPEPK